MGGKQEAGGPADVPKEAAIYGSAEAMIVVSSAWRANGPQRPRMTFHRYDLLFLSALMSSGDLCFLSLTSWCVSGAAVVTTEVSTALPSATLLLSLTVFPASPALRSLSLFRAYL